MRRTTGALALTLTVLAMGIGAGQASAQAPSCDPLNLGNVHSGNSTSGALQCTDAAGGPLSFEIFTDPAHGQALVDGVGEVSYFAPADYKGSDPFRARVTDESNGESTMVDVSVQVVNAAPVCQPIDLGEIARGGNAMTAPQCTDADGDSLTYAISTQPSKGTAGTVREPARVTYTAAPGKGGPDSFAYVASDGVDVSAPAAATVTIHNAAPACESFAGSTSGEAISVPLRCTDPDGDQVQLEIVQGPPASEGALGAIDQTSGSVTFTPAAGFSGNAIFQFRAADPFGLSSPATVAAVTIDRPGGDPPATGDDGCAKAKQVLAKAKAKLKKLSRADAPKRKIAKAKKRVRKAKGLVAAACG
jgi:hypothetical protein